MKTKLQTALKTTVDPFFFALCCAVLILVSFTASALANDVLVAVGGTADDMMMTPTGEVVWGPE